MSLDGLTEPFRQPEFEAGFWFGALGLVVFGALGLVIALVALARRRPRVRPAPIWGLLFAGAASLGLREELRLPDEVLQGLGALAVAGLVADVFGVRWLLPALAVPGAWLVASEPGVWEGGRLLVGATIVVGGWLGADLDWRYRDVAAAPVLLAVSVVGVYYAVPDTEQALVLLGAALALVALAWPARFASLGAAGALAAVGILAWTIAIGGRGRHSTIVGGVACLGLLVIEPVARALRRREGDPLGLFGRRWWAPVPMAAVHLAFVALGSRVVGHQPTVTGAAVLAVVELVGGVALVLVLGWLSRRARVEEPARRAAPDAPTSRT